MFVSLSSLLRKLLSPTGILRHQDHPKRVCPRSARSYAMLATFWDMSESGMFILRKERWNMDFTSTFLKDNMGSGEQTRDFHPDRESKAGSANLTRILDRKKPGWPGVQTIRYA